MSSLDDGNYDAFVVDAVDVDEERVRLDLTITTGAHKGDVITLTARGLGRTSLDVLGLPATLVVDEGQPRITFS